MADNAKKVTIDADYFAELYRKANETDEICKECKEEHSAEEFRELVNECDERKEKLIDMRKRYRTDAIGNISDACVLAKRCTELDDAIVVVEADKIKVIKELNDVRDENDELKAKLATAQNYEAVIAAKDREIAAVKEERNRFNAKANELKAALEQERINKCDEVTAKRLAAAEQCINTIRGFHWDTFKEIENLYQNIMAVILRYDKAIEAAR